MPDILKLEDLARITGSEAAAEEFSTAAGCRYLLVDTSRRAKRIDVLATPRCPVIGIGARGATQPAIDVVAGDDTELERLVDAIDAQPEAAAILMQVLRHNEHADVAAGLFTESLAYSTLQHGAGFRRWLEETKRPSSQADTEAPLLIGREASRLTLTFNRPHVHNAYSMALKDALCEALHLAHADRSISTVRLRGRGASFSAGGDLAEFGDATDAARAHVSRITRSAGALLAALPCASEAHVHGACIGAGIELPAFTGHIRAHPETFFQLPEVAMGLIPGAGGTVSVLKRIGRQRTAYMALSNERVDAARALDWGLVDELSAELGLDDPA